MLSASRTYHGGEHDCAPAEVGDADDFTGVEPLAEQVERVYGGLIGAHY